MYDNPVPTVNDKGAVGFKFTDVNPDKAFQDNISRIFPKVGVGTFYFTDTYYLGLSVPNLLTTQHIENKDGIRYSGVEDIHYFLTGGYVFNLNPD